MPPGVGGVAELLLVIATSPQLLHRHQRSVPHRRSTAVVASLCLRGSTLVERCHEVPWACAVSAAGERGTVLRYALRELAQQDLRRITLELLMYVVELAIA